MNFKKIYKQFNQEISLLALIPMKELKHQIKHKPIYLNPAVEDD